MENEKGERRTTDGLSYETLIRETKKGTIAKPWEKSILIIRLLRIGNVLLPFLPLR